MPQEELKALLEAAWPHQGSGAAGVCATSDTAEIGIGLDCCIKKTSFEGAYLVQTTDFFFPLVDDPYTMGRIACANVLSDLYAVGVTECDNMLMLLGVSTEMTDVERNVVVPLLMRGFSDAALEANCLVRGGQTVKNPWLLLGGVATSVVPRSRIVMPNGAVAGDVLVLTKPLGTRIIGNAFQWFDQKMPRWDKIKGVVSPEEIVRLYILTGRQMALLNKAAAELMHQFDAHACTDVTGFGLVGHARNLASFQKADVSFRIHTVPLIERTREISQACELDFRLLEGFCAETSGGLLIAMQRSHAEEFCGRLRQLNGGDGAWIVGDVVQDSGRTVTLADDPNVLSVAPIVGR